MNDRPLLCWWFLYINATFVISSYNLIFTFQFSTSRARLLPKHLESSFRFVNRSVRKACNHDLDHNYSAWQVTPPCPRTKTISKVMDCSTGPRNAEYSALVTFAAERRVCLSVFSTIRVYTDWNLSQMLVSPSSLSNSPHGSVQVMESRCQGIDARVVLLMACTAHTSRQPRYQGYFWMTRCVLTSSLETGAIERVWTHIVSQTHTDLRQGMWKDSNTKFRRWINCFDEWVSCSLDMQDSTYSLEKL